VTCECVISITIHYTVELCHYQRRNFGLNSKKFGLPIQEDNGAPFGSRRRRGGEEWGRGIPMPTKGPGPWGAS